VDQSSRVGKVLITSDEWVVPGPNGPEDDLVIKFGGRSADQIDDDTRKLIARVLNWMGECESLRQAAAERDFEAQDLRVSLTRHQAHHEQMREFWAQELERAKLRGMKAQTEMAVLQGLLADALWDVDQLRRYVGAVE
jgi:hypothetical protein